MTGDRIARAQEFIDGITDADFEAAWGTLVMVGVCVVQPPDSRKGPALDFSPKAGARSYSDRL